MQALVAPAQYGAARRVATGLDPNRLAVLLAVLQRKAEIQVLDYDVFASVAGGLRVCAFAELQEDLQSSYLRTVRDEKAAP